MQRLILLVWFCATVWAQPAPAELRQQTFEIVWSRVQEKHFDAQFNGVNWAAVRERYAPQAAAVTSDEALHQLLSEMLGELRQSHFALIPPTAYAGEGAQSHSARAETGLEVQMVEGRPTITRVAPASPAAVAGLRAGFVITQIGADSLDELLRRIAARNEPTNKAHSLLLRGVRARLRGEADSTVVVHYRDQRDQLHAATLPRRLDGIEIKMGELPAYRGHLESRRLRQGVGYVRFNLFLLPLLAGVRAAVQSLHDAPGLILDLRGNAGGEVAVTTAVAGLFHTTQTTLGTTRLRQGELHRIVLPSEQAYTKPLVILVDEGTGSAAETFAAAMQEYGRARIVGRQTPGSALPSVIEKLPTGARLQYAIGEYRTPKGLVLEGRGVIPDVSVDLTRRALLAGRDEMLEQALALLRKAPNKLSHSLAR